MGGDYLQGLASKVRIACGIAAAGKASAEGGGGGDDDSPRRCDQAYFE